jgi:ketosteroid isomerase-like protein
MSEKMTPEQVLNSVVEGINARDLDSLMTLYEPLACFASQPGELGTSAGSIQESLHGFIGLNGKLDLKVKRVLKASDLALITTEWSFSGTGSDGKHVDITSKSADVLRQQPDVSWRFVIGNPLGNRLIKLLICFLTNTIHEILFDSIRYLFLSSFCM